MRTSIQRCAAPILLTLCMCLLASCATRRLPPFERPLPRAQFQTVRTTAYTHTESDHRAYGCRSAMGARLRCGPVHSAAADWSRWPAGTVFRIAATGEVFEVDDYGWALTGRNTIDLYKPTRSSMNAWGARRVTIEILRWGDVRASQRILLPRKKHAHVRRMLREIKASRY